MAVTGTAAAFRRLHQLADAAEPRLRAAYLEAIEAIKQATSSLRLAAAIERGDLAVVDAILNRETLARGLRKAAGIIRQLTIEAAKLEKAAFGAAFTQINASAVQVAERQAGRLITRISGDVRRQIRALIVESVSGGLTPMQAARQIVPLIGLTPRQAHAVSNLRSRLVAQGAKDVSGAVQRYAEKLLRLRARTIARTETMAAANAGQQAIWLQAQANGLLSPDAKKRWITTPDDRLCPQCASVGGQVVLLNEPFQTPLGAVMNPPLHPNCRCAVALDVASLAVARGARQAAA